ncbi:hypothetical protein D3C77_470510 [compost metagenome]
MPLFATTVLAHRWQERLVRIRVRGEDKELQLGCHYRCQTMGSVAGNHCFEQAAGGQTRADAAELDGIADRQRTRLIAPRQTVDMLRIGVQGQITVIAAVEARSRIATHDALQQHPTGHLQTAAFEKACGGHYFAARYTIEVWGNALDLVNARQALGERALATGRHDTILIVFACRDRR